jgi:hypothetical protein
MGPLCLPAAPERRDCRVAVVMGYFADDAGTAV